MQILIKQFCVEPRNLLFNTLSGDLNSAGPFSSEILQPWFKS